MTTMIDVTWFLIGVVVLAIPAMLVLQHAAYRTGVHDGWRTNRYPRDPLYVDPEFFTGYRKDA